MSNKKLYMLKVACARLHDLKVQERRYKGALVKRACMHLLIKQAADPRYENAKIYGEITDPAALENLRKKVDWKSGFWGTALGRFLRPYFENGENEDAYVTLLTKHLEGGSKSQQEAAMRETLADLGVDPSKWRSLMDRAQDWVSGRGQYLKDIAKEQEERDKKQFLSNWEDSQAEYERQKKLGQERGWIPKDDDKSGRGGYGGLGWSPRRGGYLTDMQAVYDPEFARTYGLGGGGVTNNYYYYGGKPGDKPDDNPSDPPKPGATTPGPDPNPDLPGLSTVLGTSDPGAGYLSGLTIDPSKISLTGSPSSSLPTSIGGISTGLAPSIGSGSIPLLSTTGEPSIDLGSGGITVDPSSLTAAITAPAPKPTPTMSAIDKGSTIGHDLIGLIPGGDEAVDKAKDWATTTYESLPDWGKEVTDQAVTGIGDVVSGSGGYDSSKPWTGAPR